MKKYRKIVVFVLLSAMFLTGCAGSAERESTVQTGTESTEKKDVVSEVEQSNEETKIKEGTQIIFSDEQITVNGSAISTDEKEAVYAGANIIYYEEGKDETYGEGSKEDAHSKEEADKHTVVTITKPGTYTVSGSISAGQIAIDLGEDAKEDASAVVNLVLDNAEITCSVAPAIVVLNAYECGDDKEENATPTVDTTAAGFHLTLAKDSENVINGAYVSKIYKDGTTKEDVENDEAKKKYKFDAAIDSQVSFHIDAQENGKLTVNAENEGISSALHMTINGGEIVINSHDDAINTSEDYVSVLTINDGVITCDSGLGDEGDGIDSNGYIVMNGGYVIAGANGRSADSGIDSDLGIYINGGTLLASGNMYDEVSSDSKQLFAVFNFAETVKEDDIIMITNEKDEPITAFSAANDYSMTVYSQPELTEGTYHLYKVSAITGDLNGSIYTNITDYKDAVQLQTGGGFMMGGPGMGGGRPQMPEGPEFERPEGGKFEKPEGMPEGAEPPELPEGMEFPEHPEDFEKLKGEKPQDDQGGRGGRGSGMGAGEDTEPTTEFVLSKDNYQFGGISAKR